MYNGKRVNKKTAARAKRKTALLVSLLLILTMGISGTLAWLMATDDPEVNEFTPGYVPNEIEEEFNNLVKSEVKVQNTGNVNAYVRAAIVVTWQKIKIDENGDPVKDKDGKYVSTGEIAPVAPILGTDYTMTTIINDGWTEKQNDGYYYYTKSVAAKGQEGDTTGVLIEEAKQLVANGDYTLVIEILAQTIQADGISSDGRTPVEIAWGEAAATLIGAK